MTEVQTVTSVTRAQICPKKKICTFEVDVKSDTEEKDTKHPTTFEDDKKMDYITGTREDRSREKERRSREKQSEVVKRDCSWHQKRGLGWQRRRYERKQLRCPSLRV